MPKEEKKEKKSAGEKKEKTVRAPSAYNLFMKTELPRVKAENPELTHKEAFKIAAGNWKDSSDNKNKK
ncbi:yabby protein-domain-containing protein [Chytriomyces sp. MP71]|nr:yabby protein-domain-containing protein [Chytriomyces sp. MP71]